MMGNENDKLINVPKLPSKCDLMSSAQNHYSLIQELNFYPHLFSPEVIRYAMLRYEKYWLPFAASQVGVKLVAPLDIELIWVCHILDIEAYKRDCLKVGRQLIYHYIPSIEERKNNQETQSLWQQSYKGGIPLNTDHAIFPSDIQVYTSIISTDLMANVQKYREFCQQVLLPHYNDKKFLYTAIFRYLGESIYGKRKSKSLMYEKIFIRKTHILNPTAYLLDMKNLDDGFVRDIRMKYSTLSSTKTYNFDSVSNGCMFRGEVTPLMTLIDVENLKCMASKFLTFHVMGYELASIASGKQYRLKIRGTSFDAKEESTLLTFRVRKETFSKTFPQRSTDTTIQYDTATFDVLRIRISELNLRDSSVKKKDKLDEYQFDYDVPNNFFNTDSEAVGKEFKLEFSLPLAEGKNDAIEEKKSWVKFRCDDFKIGLVNLYFRIQSRTNATKSDHFCNVLKHPSLMAPHAFKQVDAPCIHKVKSIKDRYGETVNRCRVLRQLNGPFRSTEVFDINQRLICSSYTIGRESLPSKLQVADPTSCCILPDGIDAVFVIRSTNYEWGLLKVFYAKREDGKVIPSSIIFMNMKNCEKRWETLYDAAKKINTVYYKVRKNGLIVDIFAGTLSIPPLHYEYPELLSLGITILSLFHSFPNKDL